MLVFTLGGATYNKNHTGVTVLGWICVGQVLLTYILVFVIKLVVIPRKEVELKENCSDPFILYNDVYKGKKTFKVLSFYELKSIMDIIQNRFYAFLGCFPNSNPQVLFK